MVTSSLSVENRSLPMDAPLSSSIKFGIWVVALYVLMKMFYVFNEGVAQPADAMLALLALVITSPALFMEFLSKFRILFALVLWIALVNICWAVLVGQLSMTYFITFYVFNTMVAFAVYSVRKMAPDRFDGVVILALRASIAIQTVFVFFDSDIRALGTFQNPNQLAYWGIVVLSLYLFLKKNSANIIDVAFILMASYCVFESLSRAGMVSILLVFSAWAWFSLKTSFKKVLGFSAMALFGAAFILTGQADRFIAANDTAQIFEARVESKADENLQEGRNYDRITDYYEYTIFGAGEGYYSRFEPTYVTALEIHSTFATMLFSYGIVGLMLFLLFLFRIVRSIPLSLSVYLLPPLVYSITHQGLRFSFFWFLLGVMMSEGVIRQAGAAISNDFRRPAPVPRLSAYRPRGPEFLRGNR